MRIRCGALAALVIALCENGNISRQRKAAIREANRARRVRKRRERRQAATKINVGQKQIGMSIDGPWEPNGIGRI
jgi:hypothetical protein